MGRLLRAAHAPAAAAAVALVLASAGQAAGSARTGTPSGPTLPPPPSRVPMNYHPPRAAAMPSGSLPAASTTVPLWSTTVEDGGQRFRYTMVGKNPFGQLADPRITVPTPIVPLIVKLPNGDTFDPTTGDSCDRISTLTRTLASPIFAAKDYRWGRTNVGIGQYVDAFQRANLWRYTKPSGINPGYHVTLAARALPPVTVNVPASARSEFGAQCGNIAAIEVGWLNNFLVSLIPQLHAQGVSARTFPIFLLDDVVEYTSRPANCCIGGYHGAFSAPATGGHVQTFAVAMYDNSGLFGGDVAILAHEVGEWMDDPLGDNPTKPWGHTGQQFGCQANLEVGDPLTGTSVPVPLNGYTYHPQELAFLSWFYHQRPSIAVNGWYSNLGTLRSPAKRCP